jgi:N-acyl-D-aspartate/D-glutamate deacylase
MSFDGSRMIRRTTVLVRDGMMRAVGSDIVIPTSAQIVDGNGKTLLPGLFDAHTHLGIAFGEQFLRDALGFGVTTELEMGGSDASLALRKKMAAGGFVDSADLTPFRPPLKEHALTRTSQFRTGCFSSDSDFDAI